MCPTGLNPCHRRGRGAINGFTRPLECYLHILDHPRFCPRGSALALSMAQRLGATVELLDLARNRVRMTRFHRDGKQVRRRFQQSLLRFGQTLGDELQVTGDGRTITPSQFAEELAERMTSIFTRDAAGHRPSSGEYAKVQNDPHWRDLILFHEYYHGDPGKGLGASPQTGWSRLIANLIDKWRR
jgi:hypothetical protein